MIDVTKLSTGSETPDYKLRDANRAYSLYCKDADETVAIDAPQGIEAFVRTLVRDSVFHGFRLEYGKGQNLVSFPVGSLGHEKVGEWYSSYNVDAEVSLIEEISFGPDTVTTFEARLDFSTRRFVGASIEVGVSNAVPYDKLKAKWGTKISTGPMDASDPEFVETVGLDTYKVAMFGMPIEETWSKELTQTLTTDWEKLDSPLALAFLQYPTNNPTKDEVKIVPTADMGYSISPPQNSKRYLAKPTVGGSVSLHLEVRGTLDIRVVRKALSIGNASRINAGRATTFLSIGGNITQIDQVQRDIPLAFTLGGIDIDFSIDIPETNISPNTEIYLYTVIEGLKDGNTFFGAKYIEAYASITYMDFSISHNSVASDSAVRGYRIHDVLERCLLGTVGNSMLFDSPFYAPGSCGYNRLIMSGRLLRGLEEIVGTGEAKLMEGSFKDYLNSLMAMDGIGMGFEYDKTAGKEVLLVDSQSRFYGDDLVYSFTGEVSDYSETPDPADIFNKITAGYTDYVEDGSGSSKEFHSPVEFQTPIKFIDNGFELMSSIIASSFLIEKKRRESFEKETDSGGSNDEDIFVVCLSDEVSAEEDFTVSFLEDYDGYTDSFGDPVFVPADNSFTAESLPKSIIIGATITITGSSLNNGTYTVSDIGWSNLIGKHFVKLSGQGVFKETGVLITIDPLEDIYQAERSEYFTVEEGALKNPSLTYNLRLAPQYMVLNNHIPIAACLAHRNQSDKIFPTKVYRNEDFKITRLETDPCPGGDSTLARTGGKLPISLSALNGFDPLYTPEKISFSTLMSLEQFVYIANKHGRDRDNANYGYCTFVDTCGTTQSGYLFYISYQESTRLASVVLKKKRIS